MTPAPASRIPTARLLAYGGLGLPLAMAALPIYVHVPKFYADTLGLNLASVGLFLLVARIFDSVQDPLLGYWSDAARGSRFGRMLWVIAGAPILALSMLGLFYPPDWSTAALGWWLVAMLLVVYTAFSMITISYQAYGAEMSADVNERTRITSIREGLGLVGVFLAASLPEILAKMVGARAGFAWFAVLFAPLLLMLTWLAVARSPAPVATTQPVDKHMFKVMLKPFGNARFRPLLAVFVMNGIAAAIPATLVLFFIEDVIQRADLTAHFLIAYFAAGALGMPVWVRLSAAIGKGRAWFVGMLVSIIAFAWAFLLGPGDANAFFVICVLSGLGLGADLALPPSLLADVIDDDEARGLARNEGAYFGLWNLVTKMNLALAAGIALPLLSWLGFTPKAAHAPEVLTALAAVYALLPCVLKAIAAALLAFSPFFQAAPALAPSPP